MMNKVLMGRNHRLVSISVIAMLAAILGAFFIPTAQASAYDPSSTDGWWHTMELVKQTKFYVLAKSGETIHFSVDGGQRRGSGAEPPKAVVKILDNNGSQKATATANSNLDATAVYTTSVDASTPETAYQAYFSVCTADNSCSDSDDVRGYEWRIWVTDTSGNTKEGRVYWDGHDGLKTWQHTGGTQDLPSNRVDFNFRYVRRDGYRYSITYSSFQGIYTTFSNSIYPGGSIDNKGYVFVDCWSSASTLSACPNQSDISYFLNAPITGNGNNVSNTGGTSNPIRYTDSSATSTNVNAMRYTGQDYANGVISGGTVHVPYVSMQSGDIAIWVNKSDGSRLCSYVQKIDEPDGSGEVTWGLNSTSCPGIQSIASSDYVMIYAQAQKLGLMYFEDDDTERRGGGISLYGNGLTNSSVNSDGVNRNVIWNDSGYSRSQNYSCGDIPAATGQGASGEDYSGSIKGSRSGSYDSSLPESGYFWNTGNGKAHGWTSDTNGGADCDATASAGTGSSTWGNDRTINDWTYAFQNPITKSIKVGPYNWTISSSTTSSINSTSTYNNSDKTAYPSHASFGGHSSKTSDDAVYYKTTVVRSSDGNPSAATFSYRPTWIFFTGTSRSVNGGTANIGNMCTSAKGWNNWFYINDSTQRCAKYVPAIATNVSNPGGSVDIPATDSLRLWNNSLINTNPINPAPSNVSLPLRTVVGQRTCYFQEFSRTSLSQGAGSVDQNGSTGGSGDATANGCQVSVAYPWILEPKVANNLSDSKATVGDTYTVTPSVQNSENKMESTTHRIQVVRVVGDSNWTPKSGLNDTGSVSSDVPANFDASGTVGHAQYVQSVWGDTRSVCATTTSSGCNSPYGDYTAGTVSASTISESSFVNKTWTGASVNQTFQDDWYGKKVCYYTVITTGGWAYDKTSEVRFSSPQCVVWAKNPQIQIRGADTMSGGVWDGTTQTYDGGFEGVLSVDAGRGSWSQYGLSAYRGNITSFGSGGYTISSSKTNACKLTFANYVATDSTNCSVSGSGGRLFEGSALTQTISLPDEAKYDTDYINSQLTHVIGGDGVHISLSSLDSGTYRVVPNTHIDLTLLPADKQITLISTGVIYIDGNIRTADGSFSSLINVPMLTVISMKKIAISKGVDRIYGTYIAAGDGTDSSGSGFVSCYDSADLKDGGDCSRQLRIDGSVITRTSPVLQRTIGAGYSSSATTHTITTNLETHLDATTAAELFNYQPSLFLAPYALAHGDSSSTDQQSLVVTNQSILPARF